MNSRRAERAAEAIRETVSMTVLFGLRDPRVKNVTVLGAEVAADLRAAKIFVTIMGDAKAQSLAMHGLNSAKGFIQAKVADRLQTKYTPVISFVLDPSVKKSIEVSRMLQSVLAGDSADDVEAAPDHSDDDDADDIATEVASAGTFAPPIVPPPTITDV
ncbi:MAG: 30S ribosome-binding factor RbfA [Candidatus Saccharimonas sp.]|nr:30S ribosome-binding factor RbfA [Planctomycetaceae bacterium]